MVLFMKITQNNSSDVDGKEEEVAILPETLLMGRYESVWAN